MLTRRTQQNFTSETALLCCLFDNSPFVFMTNGHPAGGTAGATAGARPAAPEAPAAAPPEAEASEDGRTIAEDEDTLKLIDILADDTDLSREVDQKMLSKRVKDVLKTLSVEYREVLILRYYEDKDYAEISDILKKPMGTVATLLNRAKEQLREKMSGREQLTGGA